MPRRRASRALDKGVEEADALVVAVTEVPNVLLRLEAEVFEPPQLPAGRPSAPAVVRRELALAASTGAVGLNAQQQGAHQPLRKRTVDQEGQGVERGEDMHGNAPYAEEATDVRVEGERVSDVLGDELAEHQVERSFHPRVRRRDVSTDLDVIVGRLVEFLLRGVEQDVVEMVVAE